MTNPSDLSRKRAEFEEALQTFLERLAEDRYVLAAVLVGSLSDETIWRRDALGLWIIEADGVTKRLRYDGNDERIFRTFVEDGINIHAEIIPRSRFKRMIEGNSRTAFHCNFFARRELVYCDDASIARWFEDGNEVATRDQEKELLMATTWAIHAHRHAERLLRIKKDLNLTIQELVWAAHSVAAIEIVRFGEVYEQEPIYRALELNPELFQIIYLDVITGRRSRKKLEEALATVDRYLEEHAGAHLKPLLEFLSKQKRVVPLSEIADYFAHTQLYPWHLESACEWMERKGQLEKLALPFTITTRSLEEVEEPAYFLDD